VTGAGTVGAPYAVSAELISGEPGGCACAWAWVACADSVDLSVAGGGTDTDVAVWTDVFASEGVWSISAGNIVPPDPDGLYTGAFLFDWTAGSGSDAATVAATVTGVAAWEQSAYLAPSMTAEWTQTLLVPLPLISPVSVSLTVPAAGTRASSVAVEAMLWQMCGCANPYAESA
jgi:hypothetical protein